MNTEQISDLRNHHVKRLLNHLGGGEVAPYLQKAIKRSFPEFAEDIEKGHSHDTELQNGNR